MDASPMDKRVIKSSDTFSCALQPGGICTAHSPAPVAGNHDPIAWDEETRLEGLGSNPDLVTRAQVIDLPQQGVCELERR